MKKTLVLDNYDSFTYNLVEILRELRDFGDFEVFRNDKISVDEVDRFDRILLSPGPGLPKDAGIMAEVIRRYHASKSILGVCLGHQALGEHFGCSLYNLPKVFHGVATRIHVEVEDVLFRSMPPEFTACRYHSWVIDAKTVPKDLQVTARDDEGWIMGLRHVKYRLWGVQFHPESFMTEYGRVLVNNWLSA